ncbi:cellulase family glycosylhydrolase [Ohtaekwangia koreensis]|uniref:Aryl-phospho-beta-D-glucosidase BglC, GH1 family n=1 Tax=Ohtaekwangia koreensis TaxID=688867 RepID=A0A1T5KIN7_9BACT|nr:cellulase family glycosylhydrolase [Ohtaekwangia koreensis]SKC63592.1 Aryl-phospho-beta-D-glucosidase BglC, GH1 family [Ohtaekwangia koreensis]
MKTKCSILFLFLLVVIFSCLSCKKDDVDPELSVSEKAFSFNAEGDTSEFTITSNDSWTISNPAPTWLQLSQVNGNSGSAVINIIAGINASGSTRSAILNVHSDNGQDRRITISQAAQFFPTYNTSPKPPDMTGMSSTASELAAKMKLGWNIGNTFEAPGGETGWGSPVITEDYIKFVKQCGFNAIRIPCAWDWHHVDNKATAKINQDWMNRVKEVVGYCVKNDVYVLLNIHWDGGWLDHNINSIKKDSINAKQKAYWEQIATAMRDFDEHLMFASANEPPVDDGNLEQMAILISYHQTFINAVRSTGGKNTYRVLVVQGPSTDILKTYDLMNTLPVDKIEGRMMVEIHNYTPFQFTLLDGDASWGDMFYYWGSDYHSTIEPDRNATWGEEAEQISYFQKMKEKFVDKGIPVVMGEYAAYNRGGSSHVPKDMDKHSSSVKHWTTFVTKEAIAHGVIPFWWDTGGVLDRANLTIKDQATIDALNAGAEK